MNEINTETSRLVIAQKHIESARAYTETLLDGLAEDEWFWSPDPCVSHIAWQVGHLAFAQYGLALFRQRDRQPVDASLMSNRFRKLFRKGSTPTTNREDYPSIDEIRATFDGIFQQALKEIPTFDENSLDDPVDPPHAAFATKFGALLFCGDHEMLHAGQIGMLRRLMGKEPVR